MASGGGVVMVMDTLRPSIKVLPEYIDRACIAALKFNEPLAENWMKTNAKWTDRTSNARNGLAARYAGSTGKVHTMVLFHQVPYGIWLEVRWEGRYAVIVPAMKEFGPRSMKTLGRLLDRFPGGIGA